MLPALVLCLVLASLYAALAHFLFGRTWRQMLWYWVAGWLGFAVAGLGAVWFGWDWGRVGQAPVAAGSIGAWLALLAAKTRL